MTPGDTVLDLLWRRGFPSVLGPAGAPLPATIVWVDDPDDAALHLLPRAFGGHLMLELRDHHGEPTPAFWLGVGRGAVLAQAALARWRGRRPSLGPSLLGERAAPLWDAFDALCDGLLRPARGASAEAIVSLAERVDAALPIASHIASGIALALGSVLRASTDDVLPTRAECARWADAFVARVAAPA